MTPSRKNSSRTMLVLCSGALLAFACLGAHAAVFNPPIRMAHGVEYMSGGISSDEADLMRTVEERWPAAFEWAEGRDMQSAKS